MRRTDKEIHLRSEIDAVIRKARVCRLAMLDGDGPYIIPLSFGYDGDSLYFHSARKGKKLDLLRQNPRVCFELDVDVSVFSGDVPCKWGMTFRSVIGFGKVEFISEPDACRMALDFIMAQYSEEPSFAYKEAELEGISVFKVKILEVNGKRSG